MNKVLVVLLLLSLCYPSVASSARISRDKPDNTAGPLRVERYRAHSGYIQKGAFAYRENAFRYSKRLRSRGYEVLIVKGITSHKIKVYRVLARKTAGMPVGRSSGVQKTHKSKPVDGLRGTAANNKVVKNQKHVIDVARNQSRFHKSATKVDSVGGSGTGGRTSSADVSSAEGMGLPKGVFVASADGNNGAPAGARQEEAPVGTLRTYREMFVSGESYFHGSLSVDEAYTDNAFATQDNKKSNLSTLITPALWLTLPRVTEKRLVTDQTWNRMPGGLVISRYAPEVTRRYQAHLLYRAVIPLPSANSPYGNAVSHTGYGDLEFNGNKVSGLISDNFTKSYETRGLSVSSAPGLSVSTAPGQINRVYNNRFGASARVDTGNRLRLGFDYSNFLVHYSDQENGFMDRTDNSYSGYLFYKLRPKTAAFVEYTLIDISYDTDATHDSSEHHLMAGLQWDITAKSRGMIKAGYDKKDFSNSSSSAGTFIAEAQINHQFTPKTLFTITAFRKTDETNVDNYLYAITDQIEVGLQHILTAKITGLVDGLYAHERYKDALTAGGDSSDLENNIYQGRLALQYEFQRWLRSSLSYVYTKRESNFPDYNFSSNTIDFQITGAF